MRRLCLIAALCLLAAPAFAGDADVCYSKPSPDPANQLTSSTKLDCPRAGSHTLPQLAQAGWSIVSVQAVVSSMSDPSHPANAWMVVIEKK